VGQEESLLISIEIKSNSDYKLEEKTSTSFVLSLYTSLSSILPLISSSFTLIDSPLFYYNISQYSIRNLKQLVRQQQE